MNALARVRAYYARMLGTEASAFAQSGARVFVSDVRDAVLKGHSTASPLYAVVTPECALISVSKALFWSGDGLTPENAASRLESRFPSVKKGYLHYFTGCPRAFDTSRAVRLTAMDYPVYERFFVKQHPGAKPGDWLEEYFNQLTQNDCVFGLFVDGEIASCTDAPDVPFMEDVLVEPGINTLPEYRGKGYAQAVCAAMIQAQLAKGKTIIWSCAQSNAASARLALSLGFTRFGERYTLDAPQIP